MATTTEATRATIERDLRLLVAITATARTWATTIRQAVLATARLVVWVSTPAPAPFLVRGQAEDGLRLRRGTVVGDCLVPGSLAALAGAREAGGGMRGGRRAEAAQTDHHQDVRGDGWDQQEPVQLLELAEDFPPRREAVGAGVEREDLVVVVDVAEVGTGDSEEEGVAVVERREASQPGVGEEEPGEKGAGEDGVGWSPGRPSSSTAW